MSELPGIAVYVEVLERRVLGGLEPLGATVEQFREALTRESHTLKRALTDPRLFAGNCSSGGHDG